MDINELIYNTLLPLGVPVVLEECQIVPLPDEFIVIERMYGDERWYADNVSGCDYHVYRINYYGTSKAKRQQMMDKIKDAMKAAGFYLQEHNGAITRDANAKYWGAYSIFNYWES